MKKFLLSFVAVSLLAVSILLSGCRAENGSGNAGQTVTEQTGATFERGVSVKIVYNGEVNGTLVSLQSGIYDALGALPTFINDSLAAGSSELIIGSSNRSVTKRATELMNRNEREGKYMPRYAIYCDGSSVAIVYDECEGYNEYVQSVAINRFINDFVTSSSSITVKSKTVYSGVVDILAYQESIDNERIDRKWAELEAQMGEEITAALRSMYDMYDDKAINWLADLYAPEIGGFYSGNSARDNEGFLPCIESTAQAMDFIVLSGMADEYGGDLTKALPDWFVNSMISFVKGLQDPETGYFYHPQWGKELTDKHLARRGRDLTKGLDLLARLGAKPTYDTPNGVEGDGMLADGTPVSNLRLTSPLNGSKLSAVSNLVKVSAVKPTSHLESLAAFQKYLNELDINGDPYSVGNEIASTAQEIRARGTEYVNLVKNWLDSHCYESTGHWYHINDYMGLNGLMKITAAYSALKLKIPYPEKAANFAIDMITTTEREDTVCYAYNTWFAIGNILRNVKSHLSESEANRITNNIMSRIYENAPVLIASTHEKQSKFLMPDGAFTYSVDHASYLSQGLPASVPGIIESGINATLICSFETLNHMSFVLGIDILPTYTTSDLLRFIDRIENLGPVIKRPEEAVKMNATFDDERLGDTPVDVKVSNQSSSVIKVVEDPRPGAARSGKVLEFNAKADGAKSVMMPMDVSANPLFHCYVFEGEFCFEEVPIGYMSHLSVGPECYMIGFKGTEDMIYLYEESSDSGAKSKEMDLGVGIPLGEWFKIRVEYYIKDTDEPRIKLYVNDVLITVTDNYYNRSGVKLDGGKAVPKTRYEGTTFLVFSYYDALIYMDNLSCYRLNKDYQPVGEDEVQPTRYNVDAPDKDEIKYDFENDAEGASPDGIYSEGVTVSGSANKYISLGSSEASKIIFPVNVRTTKTNCTVFEAEMTLDSSAVGKSLTFAFTEEARVANPVVKFNITVTKDAKALIYNAPTGVSADKIDGISIPLDDKIIFRVEYYDIDRITLFYLNGTLIASSEVVCHNAQKYITACCELSASAGMNVMIDNVISERIVKDFEEAIRPSIDSNIYDFSYGVGDITASGTKIENGALMLDNGAIISIPVNQRSVVSTATIFETRLNSSRLSDSASFILTVYSQDGKAILSYEFNAKGLIINMYERTERGSYSSPIYTLSKSSNLALTITYYSARNLAYITVNGTVVAASHLAYNAENAALQSSYMTIEMTGGSGLALDDVKLESYNVTFMSYDIPDYDNPDNKSETITFEGSSTGNIPEYITSDIKSIGSSLTVKEVARSSNLTKALIFVTRPDYNDALSFALTKNEKGADTTVFEADFKFDFPTGYTSYQIYLESDNNIAYMINLNKNGNQITFNDTSGTGEIRNRGPKCYIDGAEEWHNIRIEYYNGNRETVRIKTYIDGELVLVSRNFWGSEIDRNQPASVISRVRFYTYAATDATLTLDNVSLINTSLYCADDPLTEEPDPGTPDTTLKGTATFEEETVGAVSNRVTSSHKNDYTYAIVAQDPRNAAKKVLKFYKYNTTPENDTYTKHAPELTVPLTDTIDGYNAYVFEADIKLEYMNGTKATNYKMYLGTSKTTSYTFEFYRASSGYLVFRDSSNVTSGIGSGSLTTVIKASDWFNFRLEYYVGDQNTVRIKIYFDDVLFYVSNNFYGPMKTDEAGKSYTVNNEIDTLRIVPYGDLEGTMYLDDVDLKQTSLVCANDPLGIPEIKAPEETEAFDSKVLPVKGGASSIVVLVHDDGNLETASILDKLYKKYSLSGDVAITAERFLTPDSTEIAGWQALLDTGRWGMINHSMTHDFWGDTQTGEVDEDLVYQEVIESRELLRSIFTTENFHVFAYPGISSVTNKFGLSVYDAVKQLVRENYLAGRFYEGGSASFYDWDWENMPTYAVDINSQNTLDAIERAVRRGEFISILVHRVLPDATINATPAYQNDSYYTRESHIAAVCEKIGGYVASGAVWSANYEDAVLYLREAENATVTTVRDADSITAKVDDGLDDSIYNYPLTVRISVDAAWEAVMIVQNGNTTYAKTVTQNGISFIDAEIVPDNTDAVITPIAIEDIPEEELPTTPDGGNIDFGGNDRDDGAWS